MDVCLIEFNYHTEYAILRRVLSFLQLGLVSYYAITIFGL
jgi:hypothetical protein